MEKILLLAALLFSGLMPEAAKKSLPSHTINTDCEITNLAFDEIGECDNNGTSDPDDDFFTANVVAEFVNPPATGQFQIDLGEDAILGGGVVSVDVEDLDPSGLHVFQGVRFKANNDPTEVRVFFSALPGCTLVIFDGPTVAPCSSPSDCSIDLVSLSNASPCNNNGTGAATDDFFTMNVTVTFSNPPIFGELRIEPGGDALPGGGATSVLVANLVGNSHTFTGVRFKADGTLTVIEVEFSTNQGCVRTTTGPTVNSCSEAIACDISSVTISNAGPCDDNGTTDPADDFFLANINVSFTNPPANGDLLIEPGGDALPGGGPTSVPVADLVGNSHTFSGVRFKADGTATVAEVEFSADISCVRTSVGPTVQPCSSTGTSCDLVITSVTASTETCPHANNGSITVTATTSNGPLTYSISGPVNQGNNTGVFTGLPDGNYAIIVTDNGLSNCTANSSAIIGAGVDNTPPTPVCRNTTVTLDATGNYTLTAADVFNQGASSDNCGTVNFVNVSPAAVGCAQVGQTIPATVQINDGNGNNATCTAQITVQEGTALPPGFSGANVGTANGNSIFQPCSGQKFTLSATGFSTPASDVQHLVSRQLCGNGEIIAHVVSANGGGWAGITLRETTAAGSKKVALETQLTNNIHREIRTATNGPVNNLNFFRPQDTWLRLVRNGNNFSGYTSLDGVNWNFAFSTTISMANCIRAGLFAESINVNATTTAVFDHVSVSGAMALAAPTAGSPVAIEEAASADFQVYPNPASGEITLDLSAFANRVVQLEVCDANGKTVKTAEFNLVNTTDERLDLSSLNNGIYFIRIKSVGLPDVAKRIVLQGN